MFSKELGEKIRPVSLTKTPVLSSLLERGKINTRNNKRLC